ncbi:MAG: hypothetical protein V2A71_01595, partial [Candidatus Eisenbacteria bacterium]
MARFRKTSSARFSKTMKCVLLFVLLAAGSRTCVAPSRAQELGPAFQMEITSRYAGATDHQELADAAFDGTRSLVVWMDGRLESGYDVFGARIDTAGVVLDRGGIAISCAPGFQCSPAVAFDGANYLVVWQDWRSGTERQIYGARVDTLGTVLDTAGIAISTVAGWQDSPAIAFDGTNYLVVWEDTRGADRDIYGARV